MQLVTSFLILWPCLGLTMEGPRPAPDFYSDVNACTRYNFLPINAKNFREAILFFTLCKQLIHLLPEDQQKDYAKYLKREALMTKNEFKSKNNNKDIEDWLNTRIDSLVEELNKLQPDNREKSDFKLESLWPLLPLGKMSYLKNSDQKAHPTSRYTSSKMTMQANEAALVDHTTRRQDYDEMDKEDDLLMAEEKININDMALIGLILGLVSTLSAAMTLLYICYCGAKRAKKKVISNNHQTAGTNDDNEKLINRKHSCGATDSHVSTKIAKYASGECKGRGSDGRLSQYQSFDTNCTANRDRDQVCDKIYGEESSMASGQNGKNTYEIDTDCYQTNETVQWDSEINPEINAIYLPNKTGNPENTEAINTAMNRNLPSEMQTPGYFGNDTMCSQLTVNDQNNLGFYATPAAKLGHNSKDGYGDFNGPKMISNKFSKQKLNEHGSSTSADIRETQKTSFIKEDKKTSPSYSYTQQKYLKGQVPLMNSNFPCEIQQHQLQQKQNLHLIQQPTQFQSIPDQQQVQQQPQLQDLKTTRRSENKDLITMNNAEKEQPLIYDSKTHGTQKNGECQSCKKRILGKRKQGPTRENMSTLMQMKMEASKIDSGLKCNQTDSENIMQQEKFLCSLSATTPLTTKEQCFKLDDKTLINKPEKLEKSCHANNNTLNMMHPANGDMSSNIKKPLMDKNVVASSDLHLTATDTRQITEQKQYYMSLHTPVVKKYHRQKCAHPKSPLATSLSAKRHTKMPVEEVNSSCYSMKPSSAYQSCAEVNPLQALKPGQSTVNTTESMFTSKIQEKDFSKTLKTMFSRYSADLKALDNDEEQLIKR